MKKRSIAALLIILLISATACKPEGYVVDLDEYSPTPTPADEPEVAEEKADEQEPVEEKAEEQEPVEEKTDEAEEHFMAYLRGEEEDPYGYFSTEDEDAEYVITDLNGDGQKELLIRMYGTWIPDVMVFLDGKINYAYVSSVGSSGVSFINSEDQFVSGDVTHAGREQYWVSELKQNQHGRTLVYFAKMWDDWAEVPGETEYYMLEEPLTDEFVTRDCEKITEEKYNELVNRYTQEKQLDWKKIRDIL